MEEEINEEYASLALKRFYDTATDNIQMSALINRALTDKISTETINKKVNNQLNSIQTSMYNINPKFNENSKNYAIIKQEILDVLTDYEVALTKLSDSYDIKLEELILKKVELESHLIGKIFKEESYRTEENFKMKAKQNDKLKMSFAEKTKSIFEKFSLKKNNEKTVNVQEIHKLQDCIDLESEQDIKLDKKVEKIKKKNEENNNELVNLRNEIQEISNKIDKINEEKRLAIEEAMETRDKWIAVNMKKPNVFKKAKIFLANKLNPSKVIIKTVIGPLKQRVNEFKLKDLAELEV